MHLDSFMQTLRSHLDTVADPAERLTVIADDVASFFSLRSHEIGLFSVNHKKHEISFMLPEGMAKTGHIPLNAVNSLVARTANDMVPSLDNSFVKTRHLFMFEHMLAEKSDRITVQKIMSVPILSEGVAKGVIQVGRKGASLVEAGADFTEQNLADLVSIAAVIAEYDINLP
jgi:hypothetical protein